MRPASGGRSVQLLLSSSQLLRNRAWRRIHALGGVLMLLGACAVARVPLQAQPPTSSSEVDKAGSGQKTPWTDQETKGVLKLLDDKLRDWETQPAEAIADALRDIGEFRIEAGRSYLVRFTEVDPKLPRAEHLIRGAARSLGQLGGVEALATLTELSRRCSPNVLLTVAVALGLLADTGAIPTLEEIATNPDPQVRDRAVSALSRYCATSSRPVVLAAVTDSSDEVRNAGTWWIASCGEATDAPLLLRGLEDRSAAVRANSLKGLTQLNSRAACTALKDLLKDDSPTVREAAGRYKAFCEEQ